LERYLGGGGGRAAKFATEAKLLLSQDSNGIPSVSDIHKLGRRDEDKKRLIEQIKVEKEKAKNLKREVLTLEGVKLEAKREELSNDRVMRLGDDRLELRVKIAEISTKKFWDKDLKIPNGKKQHKFIMKTAWKSFPYMHLVVYRQKDANPVRTKTEALNNIGLYLRRTKDMAKNIIEYAYGVPGNKNTVPKRDREWDAGDILWLFNWFRVGNESYDSGDKFHDKSALNALQTFEHVDPHFTYTLIQEVDESEKEGASGSGNVSDCEPDGNSDGQGAGNNEELEDEPRFVKID